MPDLKGEDFAYIGVATLRSGAFKDATALNGELIDKASPIFVSYLTLISKPKKLDIAFSQNLKENLRIDAKATGDIPAVPQYFFILFEAKKEPLRIVTLAGAVPFASAKVHIVNDYTYQSDSSDEPILRGNGSAYKMFEEFEVHADEAKKRAQLLNP